MAKKWIDADALRDRFQNLAYDDWNQGVSTTWANAFAEAADMVDDMPAADVVPWEDLERYATLFCALEFVRGARQFCEGTNSAKMDEVEE